MVLPVVPTSLWASASPLEERGYPTSGTGITGARRVAVAAANVVRQATRTGLNLLGIAEKP